MKTHFSILNRLQPDACAEHKSDFSTERSPVTALLFDAKRIIRLPIVPDNSGAAEAVSERPEVLCKAE